MKAYSTVTSHLLDALDALDCAIVVLEDTDRADWSEGLEIEYDVISRIYKEVRDTARKQY